MHSANDNVTIMSSSSGFSRTETLAVIIVDKLSSAEVILLVT